LHRDQHILTRLIGGDEVDLEAQRLAVLVEHAVTIRVLPAGFLEETARTRRVVGHRPHVRRMLAQHRRNR